VITVNTFTKQGSAGDFLPGESVSWSLFIYVIVLFTMRHKSKLET